MASTLKTSPVIAPDAIKSLLHRLHEVSIAQQGDIDKATSRFKDFDDSDKSKMYLDDAMRDKFVALDEDKCQFLYQLARAIGAKNIVEAGTSFGVSTIYLALAVGSNVDGVEGAGKVIATENETSKAKKAREYWEEAGKLVTDFVELREGNLLDTLKSHLPTIDLLLLDSKWHLGLGLVVEAALKLSSLDAFCFANS